MTMKTALKKLKSNHVLLMVLCCAVPLIALAGATYFFGLSKSYLFWAAVLICPLSHLFLTRWMHGEHSKDKEKEGCQ